MVSIVICSRKKELDPDFVYNISNTIGCDYELVIIDNSNNKHTIFEAYNLGIKRSLGEFIAFIHDDIYFQSTNWGEIIKTIFYKDESIGLLGVAGVKIKTKMPSGHWNCPLKYKEISIIQHISKNDVQKWNYGFHNGSESQVVAIDGVFMVIKNNDTLSFNEALKGFHNYDLNISFQCHKIGVKIVVTNQILIEHYSNGNINNSWYKSTYKIHEIYKDILPLKTIDVAVEDFDDLEFKNGLSFLNPFIYVGSFKEIIKLWGQLFLIKPKALLKIKFLKTLIKRIKK